jgi:uncharacterized protein YcfL
MADEFNILDRTTELADYERVTATGLQVQKTWDNRVRILWLHVRLVAANVGLDRQLIIDIRTDTTGIFTLRASAVQPLNITYNYYAQQGIDQATPIDPENQPIAIPIDLIMEKDWILRVKDINAISNTDAYTLDIRYQNLSRA